MLQIVHQIKPVMGATFGRIGCFICYLFGPHHYGPGGQGVLIQQKQHLDRIAAASGPWTRHGGVLPSHGTQLKDQVDAILHDANFILFLWYNNDDDDDDDDDDDV